MKCYLTGQSEYQFSSPIEGSNDAVILESAITQIRLNNSIPGTTNAFTTYAAQVEATYRKYNGLDSFGCQQTRAIVDIRTAFIAGEGVNVTTEDERLSKWIQNILDTTHLGDTLLNNGVKSTEMAGQTVLTARTSTGSDGEIEMKVGRMRNNGQTKYRPMMVDPMFSDEVCGLEIQKDGQWMPLNVANFVYVRTGGDDGNFYGPTTKTGIVLTDIENYDRALRDMRRNNHIMARVTPTFKTKDASGAKNLKKQLDGSTWKIGEAFIGDADFKYATPGTGAHDNLSTEMTTSIKTISSTTSVPVHYIGYVDLMSNRATAETLYELIKNGTSSERLVWEKALYDLILQMQTLYIDAGGTDISYNPDFSVALPLLDFSHFLERVKGYSQALADGVVSKGDYQNAIPGIDPIRTNAAIAEEEAREAAAFKTELENMPIDVDDDDDGKDNTDPKGGQNE